VAALSVTQTFEINGKADPTLIAFTDISKRKGDVSFKLTAPTATSINLQRVADVPIYFSDAIVRRSASLQKTTDAQVPNVMISPVLATKLGLHHGDAVRVSQGAVQVKLTAEIVSSLPANVVRLAAAHATTSVLGGMFGAISVEKI
jgi:NADH-quinone oxidoreductase subunit G